MCWPEPAGRRARRRISLASGMCVSCFSQADFLATNAVLIGGAGSAWLRRIRLGRGRPVTNEEVDAFLERLDVDGEAQSGTDTAEPAGSGSGARPTIRSTAR